MPTASHRINHQPVFVLNSVPWRESSLLADVFSRQYGRVLLVARSARKRHSELRGVLTPFVPLLVSWYGMRELKTLHRAEWLGGWPQPQGRALFSALYVNELVLKLTAREDPHPQVYDALATVLRCIAAAGDSNNALRCFEWTLLCELGFAPDIGQDEHGQAIDADARYWMRPEHAPLPLAAAQTPPGAEGVEVYGHTLQALAQNQWAHSESARQALHLNRMMLDFRLPEGIKSRQILRQLPQWASPSS